MKDNMDSIGARLRKLRLEKGLSLEEVHKKTKIYLNILKAIEEDSFKNLNPVYMRGFLKIYCKFLGVEPNDYIANYEATLPGSMPEKSHSFTKSPIIKLGRLKIFNIKIIFISVLILVFLMGLFSLGRFISSKRKAQSLKAARKQSLSIGIPKDKDLPSSIRLSMRAKEDCWIHLKVDGRVVFHSVLKRGKFESWQAKDKIEFSLGNAGALELELNGVTIAPLGRRGQAIKNIVITKEQGLKIPR